ncbi:MAG: 6-carboxytetrahydropterin synthase QueD [Anaeromicrobium sp.]|jgi:6-pyruvoyltetrahydropterin/6-carboxytetrahydropterin synthase|uniref:6-carboxytetrahydropterin synthase QueD n=1 Tax=Anaeromicrobium sp. TaxID=1929132 RepID=UPI0025F0393D|nr:6-carboxytetrahydropterin synthase QueD [Anaeromicrobium sp.]MCT4595297.1 6-carboxytetrahydropterin synthase QueD [Anaeromicrobium sp.]
MYILRAEHSFDSAHFLAGYEGKCSNIHGHRWRVVVEVMEERLKSGGQLDGMVVDFGDLKKDLKEIVDFHDHKLIIERETMKKSLVELLKDEGFKIMEVDFRPTAENFSKYFYDYMTKKGYKVKRIEVYETPTNCAIYEGDR